MARWARARSSSSPAPCLFLVRERFWFGFWLAVSAGPTFMWWRETSPFFLERRSRAMRWSGKWWLWGRTPAEGSARETGWVWPGSIGPADAALTACGETRTCVRTLSLPATIVPGVMPSISPPTSPSATPSRPTKTPCCRRRFSAPASSAIGPLPSPDLPRDRGSGSMASGPRPISF